MQQPATLTLPVPARSPSAPVAAAPLISCVSAAAAAAVAGGDDVEEEEVEFGNDDEEEVLG
jgi:hypothetical protein